MVIESLSAKSAYEALPTVFVGPPPPPPPAVPNIRAKLLSFQRLSPMFTALVAANFSTPAVVLDGFRLWGLKVEDRVSIVFAAR